MENKTIIKIETVSVLKYKHQDIEIHLKKPMNWFQIFLYKTLGFEYICGVDYIQLMNNKFKKS